MNEKYERQMKKGVLDMLVLKLLEPEPKYGYQIIQEMKEKAEKPFCLRMAHCILSFTGWKKTVWLRAGGAVRRGSRFPGSIMK